MCIRGTGKASEVKVDQIRAATPGRELATSSMLFSLHGMSTEMSASRRIVPVRESRTGIGQAVVVHPNPPCVTNVPWSHIAFKSQAEVMEATERIDIAAPGTRIQRLAFQRRLICGVQEGHCHDWLSSGTRLY